MLIRPMMFRAPVAVAAGTWNPADKSANCTLSNMNLTATAGTGYGSVRSIKSYASGKAYCEIRYEAAGTGTAFCVSNAQESLDTAPGNSGGNSIAYLALGDVNYNGSFVYGGPRINIGDTVGVAVDRGSGRVWFSKNGNWLDGSPAGGTGGFQAPPNALFAMFAPANSASGTAAFAAASFANSPPSGFSPWG